jgi:uncharacterized protein (TIGR04255 family)
MSEEKKYRKNYISEFILRMDFLEFIPIDTLYDSPLIKEINKIFVNRNKDRIIKFNNVNIVDSNDNSQPSVFAKSTEGLELSFSMANNLNEIKLSNKYLILDFKNYSTFQETFESIENIIPFLTKKGIVINRLGLRYINMLDFSEIGADKTYFSESISDLLSTFEISDAKLARSMNYSEYLIDEMKLVFQFGFYNKLYPNAMREKDIVLDYDCSITDHLVDAEVILSKIKKCHENTKMLFEQSISDKLRERMNHE